MKTDEHCFLDDTLQKSDKSANKKPFLDMKGLGDKNTASHLPD